MIFVTDNISTCYLSYVYLSFYNDSLYLSLVCWCNQTGDISTLDGTPLKLVDKFTYPRKQRLINRKGHRHEVNESMDSYQ